MENLADILKAVDSPMPLVALLILGFYALLWRYGKEIIGLLRETKQAAVETRDTAADVQTSIITNHGSKNIGDAIDRLTGWQMDQQEQDEVDRLLLRTVSEKLDIHISESEPIRAFVHEMKLERERPGKHAAPE
jgi:hypothetical protein